ncbi:diguanylate cyclase [Planktotalea sp.]
MDINFLKKMNDTHGHLMGDPVIKHAAQILQCMRK